MGVLRGEELNSVLENAPGIARIIEQYMGIAEGSIKSYAEKGAVTAEVVKDALLGAADETNAAFESMPMTWGQIWTSMQNKALSIFSPILQRINDIANTDKFSAVTDGKNALDGLAAAAKAGTVTLDVLLSIASAFIDNWGIIQPLIFGIAAAMLLYNGYLLTNNALTAISNIQKGIAAVQAYKAAAANAALSASEQAAAMSTASATAAQYGFNAALLSCPLTWVIVGIIAVVAAIYLIVAAINNMTGSAISATGIMHILQPTPPLPHAAQSPPAPSASRASSGRRKSPVGHMQSVQPAAPGCRPPWLCPASSARKRSVRRPLQAAGWPTPARPSPSRLEE